MADFNQMSAFRPNLRPVNIQAWYSRFAVTAPGYAPYYISADDRKIIDDIQAGHLSIGELNEKRYTLTHKLSPLSIVQLLLELHRRGLLENGKEFMELLPKAARKAPLLRTGPTLLTIPGIKSRLALVLPVLLLGLLVFGLRLSGARLPGLIPFPWSDNPVSLVVIPLLVIALCNLRGLLSIILFMALGGQGGLKISFRALIPVVYMEKRAILTSFAAGRWAYYLSQLLLLPALAMITAGLLPQFPAAWQPLTAAAIWCAAGIAFFDLYLLSDSLLLRLLEELSREPGLKNIFRTFWKRGFATLQSLFRGRFPKEELYYFMGMWQLTWFFIFFFLYTRLLNQSLPGLVSLSLITGAVLFFAATFIPFLLRKTAGLTFSLFDIGAALVRSPDEQPKAEGDTSVELHEIHIFATVPERELEKIREHVAVSKRNPYKLLIKEGELGNMLFAIRKGKAQVFKTGGQGQEITLALLQEGDVFGERAILGDGKRTASVRSLCHMELYIIPRDIFLDNIKDTIGDDSRVSEIIMAANAISSTAIFEELPAQMIMRFAAGVKREVFTPGTVILKKDDASNETFYVIKRGDVKVHEAGPNGEDVILGPNAHFGEIALLNDSPRTATITAETETEVFAFHKKDFLEVAFTDLGALLKMETEGRRRLAELLGDKA